MKTLNSFLILTILTAALIYALSFAGCNNPITDTTGNKTFEARTERDFILNNNLIVSPGSVVVMNLEDYNSPLDTIPDTGIIGEDVFPIRYTENAFRNISIGVTSNIRARLVNEYGSALFELSTSNPHVYVNVPAGDYKMYVTSTIDYNTDSTIGRRTIFIQPDISSAAGSPTYDLNKLNTILLAGNCPDCDLRNAFLLKSYLSGAYMPNAKLSGANLRLSEFLFSNLSGADLSNTDLIFARLRNTNLAGATLTNSSLFTADLFTANLYAANMTNVNLNSANMSFANLEYANLSNSNLAFANLDGARIGFANFCGANKTGISAIDITFNSGTQCWP